ncbi:MAG: EAL domain-containing protein [Culicoidibacterales bacterium]
MRQQRYQRLMKRVMCICVVSFLVIQPVQIQAETTEQQVVKVGFYEYGPYYYMDEYGNPQGYYHELLELFARKLDFEYEYVPVTPLEMPEKIESGVIDLGFGAVYTKERAQQFVYSRLPLQFENHAIYVQEKNLESLEGKKVGYLVSETHNAVFAEQIRSLDERVQLEPIETSTELKQRFINQELDAVVANHSSVDFAEHPKIHSFSTGPVYLMAAKEQRVLMTKIDNYLQAAENSFFNPALNIYNSFFNQSQRRQDFLLGISVILLLLLAGVLVFFGKRDIQYTLVRRKVKSHLRHQRYCLYYQPILNHQSGEIVSAEALLRLRQGEAIISPYHFLPEIEQARMMYPVTLYIFQQIVSDYETLKASTGQADFYISLNVSFAELSHPNFLRDILAILAPTQLAPQHFCFEIVERQKLTNSTEVLEVIRDLQSYGFQIALDDFGTEYSNFDILDKIPYDILKVDKYLIDGIETSFVRQAIVRFLTEIADVSQTRVVLEGIETPNQLAFLQQFPSEIVFIQGYYYSPPQPLEKFIAFARTQR